MHIGYYEKNTFFAFQCINIKNTVHALVSVAGSAFDEYILCVSMYKNLHALTTAETCVIISKEHWYLAWETPFRLDANGTHL